MLLLLSFCCLLLFELKIRVSSTDIVIFIVIILVQQGYDSSRLVFFYLFVFIKMEDIESHRSYMQFMIIITFFCALFDKKS